MLPSSEDFVLERASQRIGVKSSLIEYAALERGLRVSRYDRRVIVVEGEGALIAFTNMNGLRSSQVGRFFCDRKEQARSALSSAGLTVTPSGLFSRRQRDKAWEYAMSFDSPAVIKPTNAARGRGITTGISTREQFDAAWKKAFENTSRVHILVEQQVVGEDFRFYVIGDRKVFCTHRKRANVTGDGESSLAALIAKKNAVRSQNPYLGNYLIPTNSAELDRLPLHGWDLNYIPAEGETVELRGASNLSAGGDSIDYTDVMHPGFRELVIQVVKTIPGMEYAGVDIIAPSITVEPTPDNHVVSEVEYSPAPITHFPAEGRAHDMAGALLDYYLELYREN